MIGFVVALESELKHFAKELKDVETFKLAGKKVYKAKYLDEDVVIIISDIGKVSATISAQALFDKYAPDFIINFGTCGGHKNVSACKFYIVDEACQYDIDLTKLEDVKRGYNQGYDSVYLPCYTQGLNFLETRKLTSADKFTSEKEDIDAVNEVGAELFDMEGGAIAQVGASNGFKPILIKAVSDIYGSGSNAEQFRKNMDFISQNFPDVIKKCILALKK